MHASEESFEDTSPVLSDDLDGDGSDFGVEQDDTSRKGYGYQMQVRRRLEQLREERELAYLLRGEFDL